MALFDENVTVGPAPRGSRGRGAAVGGWCLTFAIVVLLVLTFLPTAYVIQQPGPVFNTLGAAPDGSGGQTPLITVHGATSYPSTGTLDLLTVQTVGSPARTPSWVQLAAAWFDRSQAVLPLAAAFPAGQSQKERDQQSTAMMVDSQKEATAAALIDLGYHVVSKITVYSLIDGSAAAGILRKGDVIVRANGTAIDDADTLRTVIADAAGGPVALVIDRGGVQKSVSVTPQRTTVNGAATWLIGVTLITDFDFPIDVQIQLNNVGGPSAGMMFALGIIDALTPGNLAGDATVAGTGTIDAAGEVGPIGGIRQKLFGARRAGAQYFLAPASNCNEVVGHIPQGLRVFAVKTLDDSLHAVAAIRTGTDLNALPVCTP
ncbi:PDZ domain-containing protein [Microbacterium kribbense]|uniref:endopeptidase La n=1 Tax=Microbacterium kribbense TaxID=433645 RepID=A0ABP7GCK7_9MICO